jgi:hypothetical protein
VHRWRAIERQTYQHVFFREKLTPLVVEQRAIGLQREIKDALWPSDLFRLRDKSSIKVDTHQRGFATLKRDRNFTSAVRLNELGQILRNKIIGHPEAVAGIQLFL